MSEEVKVTTETPTNKVKAQKTAKQATPRKRVKISLTHRRMIVGYVFILPWLIGFFLFYVRSIYLAGQFSLSKMTIDANVGGYTLDFIGLENYIKAFREHASFKQVLTTSVTNMLVDVPLVTFFSLFMAILLNQKFRGRSIFRAIFFLPIILNAGAITAALDLSASMMNGGVTSQVTEMTTTTSSTVAFSVDYLIDMFVSLGIPAKLRDYMVAAVDRINDNIRASGVQIVIFIAALQSIPSSLYEVAKIEGATGYETFWKVTFPMVMPHIITNIVYTIVDSLWTWLTRPHSASSIMDSAPSSPWYPPWSPV